MIYGDFGTPSRLDPITAGKPVEKRLLQFIFDSLVVENEEGEFIFSLARDVDISPDGLSYTFILRDKLFWQDGTPLTARDVEFTLGLLFHEKTMHRSALLAQFVEDVTFINPKALTITMSRPFYRPLSLFTFKILPKHIFRTNYLSDSHPFSKNPVGCGPFKYESGLGTDTITLTANKYFQYRHRPFLEKIILRVYQEREQAKADLKSGKIHLIPDLQSLEDDLSLTNSSFSSRHYHNEAIHFIALNNNPQHSQSAFLGNSLFRRALLQAINREEIISKAFHSPQSRQKNKKTFSILTGPFPVRSWVNNPKIEAHAYDLSYANRIVQEIFQEQGYRKNTDGRWSKNGENFRLSLHYPKSIPGISLVCQEIQKSFRSLGIEITLVSQEEDSERNDFDLVYKRYHFETTLDFFSFFESFDYTRKKQDFSSYRNSQLVELTYELNNTLNPWSIQSICHQIHGILHRDVAYLFLWQIDSWAVHTQRLQNIKIHPHYFFHFPEDWKMID